MYLDLGVAKSATMEYSKIALSLKLRAFNKLTSEWVSK